MCNQGELIKVLKVSLKGHCGHQNVANTDIARARIAGHIIGQISEILTQIIKTPVTGYSERGVTVTPRDKVKCSVPKVVTLSWSRLFMSRSEK